MAGSRGRTPGSRVAKNVRPRRGRTVAGRSKTVESHGVAYWQTYLSWCCQCRESPSEPWALAVLGCNDVNSQRPLALDYGFALIFVIQFIYAFQAFVLQ